MDNGGVEGASVGEDALLVDASIVGSNSRSGIGEETKGRRVTFKRSNRREALTMDKESDRVEDIAYENILCHFEEKNCPPLQSFRHAPLQTHFDNKLSKSNELQRTSGPSVNCIFVRPSSGEARVQG